MQDQSIRFFFDNVRINLRDRHRLRSFLISKIKDKSITVVEINFIFCSDLALRKINKEHLQHNYYTDIITFNLSKKPRQLVAEIYISVDRVRKNASIQKVTINNELHRVIFHGILHLIGYNDKNPDQVRTMRKMEDQWLNEFFQ